MTHEARAPLLDGAAVTLGERPPMDRTGVAGVVRAPLDEPLQRDAARLLTTLAHDVRQPLTSIRMNVQTALRLLRGATPRLDVALGALDDALLAEGAAADIVRAASERLALGSSTERLADLNAAALDVQRQLRAATATWGARLVLDLDARVPLVKADPLWLHSVMLSLVLAAIDIAESGEPSATAPGRVVLGTRRREGDYAELSLRGTPPSALRADRDFWTQALGAAAAHAWKCHTVVESLASGVTVRVLLPAGPTSTHAASEEVEHGDAPPGRRR